MDIHQRVLIDDGAGNILGSGNPLAVTIAGGGSSVFGLANTLWTDGAGNYYVRREIDNGGTFTIAWEHQDGTTATPASPNTLVLAAPSVPAASATANGMTSSRVNSAATTNATSLKASAGNIGDIDVFNNASYAVYLKFYNKASAPAVGTDTPVWTVPVPAGAGFSRSFPVGKSFATGIAYAVTKLQADTDTTAVAAGDLTGAIDWI